MSTSLGLPVAAPQRPLALDLDALYRSARDDVFAYVATLLGDAAAAEDVTAQAFERAIRRQRSYDARRGSPRAWLFGIARHAALDELRRRRRGARLAAEPPDPAARRRRTRRTARCAARPSASRSPASPRASAR